MPLKVALTFDAEHPDRPTSPGMAELILSTLSEHGVRATFFIQGRWAEAYPDVARRIRIDGHLIGSHSQYHAHMPMFTADAFDSDIRDAEGHIRRILDVDPQPWFRFPFGDGHTRQDLCERLQALGYRSVLWNVEADDWSYEANMADEVERRVVEGVRHHPQGAVVLLHTWPSSTAVALPRIVSRLADSDAVFVGLDDLDDATITEVTRP